MTPDADAAAGDADEGLVDAVLVDTSVEIDAPLDVAWAVLTDLPSYRAWNPYIVQVDGDGAPGSTVIVHAAIEGIGEVSYPVDVVSVEPPASMRWEGGHPDRAEFKGDHHWDLEPLADGRTRLRHWEVLSGTRRAEVVPDAAPVAANFDLFNRALAIEAERRHRRDATPAES